MGVSIGVNGILITLFRGVSVGVSGITDRDTIDMETEYLLADYSSVHQWKCAAYAADVRYVQDFFHVCRQEYACV